MRNWLHLFKDDETEVREEERKRSIDLATLSELFSTAGYREHIRQWLDDEIDQYEVGAGQEKEMLLAVGIRQGLLHVKNHLTGLERELAQERLNE